MRVHGVGHQEVDTRQDIAFVVGAEFLQLTEVVEGYGYVPVRAGVELEVGRGDAVIRGEHPAHDVGRDAFGRNGGAVQREENNLAFKDSLNVEAAFDLHDAQDAVAAFGDRVTVGAEQFVNLFESSACCL